MSYTPMPAVPTTPDAAWGQLVNDNITYLAEGRAALVGWCEAQDVTTDDPTELTLTPTVEATEAGLYLATAHVIATSAGDPGTRRYIRLTLNGSTTVALRQGAPAPNGTYYSEVTDLVRLDEGDTLGITVYHDAGSTLTHLARLTALLVAP